MGGGAQVTSLYVVLRFITINFSLMSLNLEELPKNYLDNIFLGVHK